MSVMGWSWLEHDSPVGRLRIFATDAAIKALLWPADGSAFGRVRLPSRLEKVSGKHRVLEQACRELDEYFEGRRKRFELPLDPEGTPFQLQAWKALRTIPWGETRTYREQALVLGDFRKARAVGAANGRNPISIFVPCHRVIGAGGALTGFAGGLEAKQALLALESSVKWR